MIDLSGLNVHLNVQIVSNLVILYMIAVAKVDVAYAISITIQQDFKPQLKTPCNISRYKENQSVSAQSNSNLKRYVVC